MSARVARPGASARVKVAAPDKKLLATVAKLVAVQAEIDAGDEQGRAALDSGDTALQQRLDAQLDTLQTRRFWPLADKIADTPARTMEGLRAKAAAARIVYFSLETDDGGPIARHMLGLVREVLGEAGPPSPDAELLRLCASFQALDADFARRCKDESIPCDDVRPAGYDDTADAIIATPALTREGQQAKARAAVIYHMPDDPPADLEMAWSVIRDLAGEG